MVGNIHRKEQKRKQNTKAFKLGEIRVTAGDQVSKFPPSDSFSSLPRALTSVAEDSACPPSLPLPSGDGPSTHQGESCHHVSDTRPSLGNRTEEARRGRDRHDPEKKAEDRTQGDSSGGVVGDSLVS